jgi:hypothetical protein
MDDSNTPDLIASTGNSDASSPWNGLLQTALQGGLSVGTTALNNALGKQTPLVQTGTIAPNQTSPAGQVTPTAARNGALWLLIALSAAGVALIYFVVKGKA